MGPEFLVFLLLVLEQSRLQRIVTRRHVSSRFVSACWSFSSRHTSEILHTKRISRKCSAWLASWIRIVHQHRILIQPASHAVHSPGYVLEGRGVMSVNKRMLSRYEVTGMCPSSSITAADSSPSSLRAIFSRAPGRAPALFLDVILSTQDEAPHDRGCQLSVGCSERPGR